jgi:hypothetical protein
VQPIRQPLSVELDVTIENAQHVVIRKAPIVTSCFVQNHRYDPGFKALMPPGSRALFAARQFRMCVDEPMHVGGQARDVAHLPVMRDVHCLRIE